MNFSGEHIFVVDDNVDVLHLTCQLVSTLGLTCRPFTSARDCLAEILASAPACVVSDFNMPGMNGLEFMEALRSHRLEIPVVVVTARHPDSDEMDQVRRLASTVLSKPCSIDALGAAIERAMEPHRSGRSTLSQG